MNKRKGQHRHAKRRALERYGVEVNAETLKALEREIRAGKGVFIEKKSHRISIFRVREFIVAYDKTRGSIATFLPKDAKEVES